MQAIPSDPAARSSPAAVPRRVNPLALIFTTVVVDLIGFGVVLPVLPLYSERFGATPFQIGALTATMSVAMLIATPLLGKLSDRVGRRPVLAVSVLGTAVSFVMMGTAQSLTMLFVARALDGFTAGNITTAQAYIADVTPKARRTKGIGLISAGFAIGLVVGPMLGALAARFGPSVPFFCAAALAAMNGVAILLFLPESLPAITGVTPEEPTGDCPPEVAAAGAGADAPLGEMLRERGLRGPIALYATAVFSMTMVYTTIALFVSKRYGLAEGGAGAMYVCMGLAAAGTQFIALDWLTARFRETTLARGGLLASAVFMAAFAASPSPVWFALAITAFGASNSVNNTLLLSLVSQRAPASRQGQVIGVSQGFAGLSRVLAPLAGGWLLGRLGPAAPMLAAAGVSLVAGLATFPALAEPVAPEAAADPVSVQS